MQKTLYLGSPQGLKKAKSSSGYGVLDLVYYQRLEDIEMNVNPSDIQNILIEVPNMGFVLARSVIPDKVMPTVRQWFEGDIRRKTKLDIRRRHPVESLRVQ